MMRWWSLLVAAVLWMPFAMAAEEDGEAAKVEKAFATLATFREGPDAASMDGDLQFLERAVVAAARDPARRGPMEQRLAAFLESDAGAPGKALACKHLVVVASEASVPALSKLLGDPGLSHMARHVLERIPGSAATKALRDALGSVGDAQKLGVIHSLGRRADAGSVSVLAALAEGPDAALAAAAVAALGGVPDDRAEKAVAKARGRDDLKAVATDAWLAMADRHTSRGRASKASAMYRELLPPGNPAIHRIAAVQGLARVGDRASMEAVMGAMDDADAQVRAAVLPALRDARGSEASAAIAKVLPAKPADLQAALLLVLADRGDAAGRAPALAALGSGEAAVRAAAARALASVGDGTGVAPLARIATSDPDAAAKEAAQGALARMTGAGVDDQLAVLVQGPDRDLALAAIAALGARGAAAAAGPLLGAARGSDAGIRIEALKALRSTAGGAQASEVVKLLLDAADGAERGEAEQTAVAVCRKASPGREASEAPRKALEAAPDPAARASLVRVLGTIAETGSVDAVAAAARDADAAVADAAVRALADWPDAAPIDALAGLARDASTETQRLLALRGHIRMIGLLPDETEKGRLARYEKALALAARPDEKTLVLSRLGEMRIAPALELAKRLCADPALADAAKLAVEKIERNMSAPPALSASANADKAALAMDGKMETRWDTGGGQQGGEWFLVDFGEDREVSKLVLDTTGSNGDYPRGFEVFVSGSPERMGDALAKGSGEGSVTEIAFPPRTGRYLKIVQTGRVDGLFWSIHELRIEARPAGG